VIYFSLKLFRVYRSYLSSIHWVFWVILEYTWIDRESHVDVLNTFTITIIKLWKMYHRVVFLFLLLLRSYRLIFLSKFFHQRAETTWAFLLVHAIRSSLRYHKIQSIVVRFYGTCNIVLCFLLKTHLLHASSSSPCS